MSRAALHLESQLRQQANPALCPSRHFARVLRAFAASGGEPPAFSNYLAAIRGHGDPLVKSAAITTDGIFADGDGRRLAMDFLETLAEVDAIEALRSVATTVPRDTHRVLVASGTVAFPIQEALPKVVTSLDFVTEALPPTKVAAMIVVSDEVSRITGAAGNAMYERELRAATIRAGNAHVLDSLPAPTLVAGDGTPAGDLAAAIDAADDDTAYVVLADRRFVRGLALASDGRLPISGGTYSPGVVVIAHDGDSGTPRVVAIPATRCRLIDFGVDVRHTRHADVSFAASPTAPSEIVNLWQTGCQGVLFERHLRMYFDGVPGAVA